jgi:cytochrome c oxidase subunit 1
MPMVTSLFAVAMMVGQLIFIINVVKTIAGKKNAEKNPWQATTLEWTTESPPPHGNWGDEDPVVHRGAYEYGNDAAEDDYVPQTVPATQVPAVS